MQNDREWAVFCIRILERPDLIKDPRFINNETRAINRHDTDGLVAACFAKRDVATLARHHGEISSAARELQVSRTTMWRLMKKHGIGEKT